MVGGVETYVQGLLSRLVGLGHSLYFLYENDADSRSGIEVPNAVPSSNVNSAERALSFSLLRAWKPDVVYVQQIHDEQTEAELLATAPAVLFLHSYQGACISGSKTFQFPAIKICSRDFGWPCLLHYFPHRCGGLNPVTMGRHFFLQARRAKMLENYRVLLTQSNHMLSEYRRQHPSVDIRRLALPVEEETDVSAVSPSDESILLHRRARARLLFQQRSEPLKLLFLGRFEMLKGGSFLLDSLPAICDVLQKPLHVTFAGEGRSGHDWRSIARNLQRGDSRIEVSFPGWLDSIGKAALFRDSDLLVIPSVWPEPFGLVGPEAGRCGLPAAAFKVGGIPDWLTSGVNGYFAEGSRPDGRRLAEAIAKCFASEQHYMELSRGSVMMSSRYQWQQHLEELISILEGASSELPFRGSVPPSDRAENSPDS